MSVSSNLSRVAGALIAAAAALSLTAANAQDAQAADFAGKRVTILVPFAEGGGTDAWNRLLAPYLEKALPGNPRVLIVNRPGAGGITGANYYNAKAPKDGTWIFALSIATAMNYALRDPRFDFKFEDYYPVLNLPRGGVQYIHGSLGVHEISDLKGKIEKMKSFPVVKLTYGGNTPTATDLTYRVALSLLGVEVTSVWGLSGGPRALAFERGELMLNYDASDTFLRSRQHMIEAGTAQPLFTLGTYDADGKYGRDPLLPDTPTFVEFYEAVHGKTPSGPGFEAWKALMGVNVPMAGSLLLHGDVSKDAVEAWRTAVRKMLEDPEFVEKVKPTFGPYPQIVGEAARPLMDSAFSIPPDVYAWLAEYVKSRHDVELGKGG